MSIRQKLEAYLLSNPIDRDQQNPYQAAADTFGVDKELVRTIWRKLRRTGLVETNQPSSYVTTATAEPHLYVTNSTSNFKVSGDSSTLTKTTTREVRNELDLAEECDIDLSVWAITEWECKRYNAWIKNKAGEIESQVQYSIYCKMKRKTVDRDPGLQKDILMKELFEAAPDLQIFEAYPDSDEAEIKDTLYELSLPDLHIGKLAHHAESGQDYDSKIACARFEEAISELLSRTNLARVERILFPVGNDFLQIDNNNSATTAGTLVDSDSRFSKMVKIANEVLIRTITRLATIAPVDVVVVPGNHDRNTMFLIGCVLEAYFHNTDRVTVDNTPAPRKYYRYGKVGIQLSHGDEEKHQELGLIFATEQPVLWAETEFRFAQLGHLHKTKKTNWISVDEHQGFQVEIIPSLSSADAWHARKGYMSKKAAKSFLYHPTKGRIAEYTYTV